MTLMRAPKRLPIALIAYVGWTLVTLFGMRWASDGSKQPLVETVTTASAGISRWRSACSPW